MTTWELVRVAPEILARLEAEGSEPVHVIGVERQADGTLEMVLRTPERFVYYEVELVERLREALREAIGWSYGEDVTPERRAEAERLLEPSAETFRS